MQTDRLNNLRAGVAVVLFAATAPAALAAPFHINLIAGPTLAANPTALAAFDRAAARWEDRLVSPVTININADFGPLDANVIGGAGPVTVLQGTYDEVRDQLALHKQSSPDAPLYAALPHGGINAILPSNLSLTGNLLLTKANAKAMGFMGLDDPEFGASDGTITFSNDFAFDFDRSDGVDGNKIDFETAATHEIGHVLGFLSSVDNAAAAGGASSSLTPSTLDLFRFQRTGGFAPHTLDDFTNLPRDLTPGDADETTDLVNHFAMSDGTQRQASHWLADDLGGPFIGIMDPTVAFGQVENPTNADFRALELIGYDVVAIPEPAAATVALLATLTAVAVRHRRREQPAA